MTGRRVRQVLTADQYRLDDVPADLGVYAPSRHDPVVRAASAVVGGPAGSRLASRPGIWRAASILVLLACAVLSLGLVQKQHCRAAGWSSPDQFWHACYSDIPVLYGSNALGATPRPGLVKELGAGGLGQPPIAGTLMWITSAFVTDSPNAAREYFDLSAALLALLLGVGVAAVAFTAGRRSWDAAHLALSPVLITAGLISYELLAVCLTAAALLALARNRALLGGVLFGLAVASAPQVAVLAVVVAVLVTRYLRSTAGLIFAGSAAAGWLVVRILLLPGYGGGLDAAFTSWRHATPGYGSLWLIPQLLGVSDPQPATSSGGRALQTVFGWLFDVGPISGPTSSGLAVILFGGLAAVVLRLTVVADRPADRAGESGFAPRTEYGLGEYGATGYGEQVAVDQPERPAPIPLSSGFVTGRVAPLGLALLAAVLITDKSLPIQASLLLLPLIALSGLRWRDHLIWAAAELTYFVGIWLYIAGETTPNRGLPAMFYLFLVVIRLVAIGWIGAQGVLAYRAAASQGVGLPVENTALGRLPVDKISSQVPDAGRVLNDRSAYPPHSAG